jgi:ribosomal protein L11 methyltransferase
MEHFHAMQFGQRLWVCPLHMDPPEPDATNLRLDPGLAFGTGTHPTTSLCLRWLDQNVLDSHNKQSTLLDYGCGSGILAIAACMLGIDHADGVDIDPQALTATHDNAETNQVRDKIETFLPDNYQKRHAGTQYDIVVANILSGPLAELASMLAGHTKAGGDIVLSGILREQAEHLVETYSQFFKMDEPVFEEDWVLLHGVKKK